MKVTNKTYTDFEPITLEITLENQDEVLYLWHRLNLAKHDIDQTYRNNYPIVDMLSVDMINLWRQLDMICNNRGIDPRVKSK